MSRLSFLHCLSRPTLAAASILIFSVGAGAQAPRSVAAGTPSGTPVVDGVVNEQEWEGAAVLTDFVDPLTSSAPADNTVVYLTSDASAIYLAIIAYDSEPNSIVGREVAHGAEFEGEDVVTFLIDPYNNRTWSTSNAFSVNVLNTQNDRIAGGRAAKREWRGVWTSATKRRADGWSAEFRIPWSILNVPRSGASDLSINLSRYQARTRVRSVWANWGIAEDFNRLGWWRNVQVPEIKIQRPLEALVYVAPEYEDDTARVRSGLDVRYRITNDLTTLATIAPDFRNIEAQIAGVEFTRTERFLDESRPFFTEGSGYFHLTGSYTIGQLFYSRRLETFDFGAKAFGKVDSNWDIGALATYGGAGDKAGVFRLQRRLDAKSTASVFATASEFRDLSNSVVGTSNTLHRGSFGLDGQFVRSTQEEDGTREAHAIAVFYEVPQWFWVLRSQRIDANFKPSLGYIPWTDRKGTYFYGTHNREIRTGPLRSLGFDIYANRFTFLNGDDQEDGYSVSGRILTASDHQIGYNYQQFRYFGALDNIHGVSFTLNQSNRFRRLGGYFEQGRRGANLTSYFSLNGSLRVLPRLDVGASFAEQNYLGISRQYIVTVGYEVSRTQAINVRVVQTGNDFNMYMAIRHAGAEGLEWFVTLGDPNVRKTLQRASVKLVWAF